MRGAKPLARRFLALDLIRIQQLNWYWDVRLFHVLRRVLRMRTERSNMRRSACVMLAALFCALAVSQSTRPLYTITLSSTRSLAIHYRKFARYAVEEVGSKTIEPSTSTFKTVSLVVAEPEPESAAASKVNEADLTEWSSKYLFHRRTLPPSPDDGN